MPKYNAIYEYSEGYLKRANSSLLIKDAVDKEDAKEMFYREVNRRHPGRTVKRVSIVLAK